MDIGPVDNRVPDHQPNKKSPDGKPPEEPNSSQAKDRVEISLEARARLSELADQARASEVEALNDNIDGPDGNRPSHDETLRKADSVAEIRERIESGFYDRSDVMDQIADKLSDDFKS